MTKTRLKPKEACCVHEHSVSVYLVLLSETYPNAMFMLNEIIRVIGLLKIAFNKCIVHDILTASILA